jgi:uncharacterized protein YbaR (Trm112 family)
MHLDLIDILRCPLPHEKSWLVAAVARVDGRRMLDGTLGCPVCGTEYVVREGVAEFSGEPDVRQAPPLAAPVDETRVLRAAALLGLGEAGRVVMLAGGACDVAPALGAFPPVHVIAINPAHALPDAEHVSVLAVGTRIPLAPASLHGAQLDDAAVERWGTDAIVPLLKPRGRLIAPASAPVPAALTLLARDERAWVAERGAAATPPVPLVLAR